MKLNHAQIERFHFYVQKWQCRLSLGDWRVEYSNKPAPKGAMACVEFDEEARLVTYRLGDFGNQPITEKVLEETAIHELLHVRLKDLIVTAQGKDDDMLESQEHRVINVFERLLIETEYGQSPRN